MVKAIVQNKTRLGQGRAGLKGKLKIPTPPQHSKSAQVPSKTILQNPESTTQPQTSLESGPQT